MRLRSFPSSENIIQELWTYSKRGNWRFFQIENASIAEICQDRALLKNPFIEITRTVRGVIHGKRDLLS